MATASARFETKKRITFFFFFYRRRYGTDKIIWCYSEPLKWLLLHGGDKGDGEVSVSEAYARLRATVIFANEKRSKKSFGFESKQLFFRKSFLVERKRRAPPRWNPPSHPPRRRRGLRREWVHGNAVQPHPGAADNTVRFSAEIQISQTANAAKTADTSAAGPVNGEPNIPQTRDSAAATVVSAK